LHHHGLTARIARAEKKLELKSICVLGLQENQSSEKLHRFVGVHIVIVIL
jgi:hypothetical protein